MAMETGSLGFASTEQSLEVRLAVVTTPRRTLEREQYIITGKGGGWGLEVRHHTQENSKGRLEVTSLLFHAELHPQTFCKTEPPTQ